MSEVAVVVGVGPGLGGAIAARFARGGFAVALMSRSADTIAPVQAAIERAGGRALGVRADASDPASVRPAFAEVREALGDPSVLVYNAGAFQMGGILDLAIADMRRCLNVSVIGALACAQEVLPKMIEAKAGTVIFTGATASLRGSARFGALAAPKFAQRALAQSMARELGPEGIHVGHVIIDGQVDLPRTRKMAPDRPTHTFLNPEAVAESYWHLHTQHPSAWTFELDLRPAVERW